MEFQGDLVIEPSAAGDDHDLVQKFRTGADSISIRLEAIGNPYPKLVSTCLNLVCGLKSVKPSTVLNIVDVRFNMESHVIHGPWFQSPPSSIPWI